MRAGDMFADEKTRNYYDEQVRILDAAIEDQLKIAENDWVGVCRIGYKNIGKKDAFGVVCGQDAFEQTSIFGGSTLFSKKSYDRINKKIHDTWCIIVGVTISCVFWFLCFTLIVIARRCG